MIWQGEGFPLRSLVVNKIDRNTLSPARNALSATPPLPAAALAAGSAVTAFAAGLFAYSFFVEPQRIDLEELTLLIPNARGRLPVEGLRILHLSDSHFQGKGWREQPKINRIRRLTEGLDYDLLIHTGDFIHYDSGLETAMALLDVLPAPRLGRYAVLGNHDYAHYAMEEALPRMWKRWRGLEAEKGVPSWLWPARLPAFVRYVRHTPLDGRRSGHNDTGTLAFRLEEAGFHLLHNRSTRLTDPARTLDFVLAGVEDVTEADPRLEHTLDGIPAETPLLLLSHNPDILSHPAIERVDVVLAGHTHGGQIVVPFWGPAHTQSWHLQRSQVAGYFRRGRTHVYITRGVGEGIPLRLNAPPQIALITLLPE